MNEREAQRIVTVLVTAFPNTISKLSETQQEDTMGIYRRMLVDLEYPAVNAAVERLLATCRFMPTVAEIRDTALTLATGDQAAGGEQWGKVLRAISEKGVNRTPGKDFVFHDPVTMACVTSFGWRELCNSENPIADRARFIELYDKLAVNYRRKQLSEHLPAMQRYRALEEVRVKEIEAPRVANDDAAPKTMREVLRLVAENP